MIAAEKTNIWIEKQVIADERGNLLVAEAKKNIPFEIKRVYCLYGLNDAPRGFHAHKALQQVVFCLSGACNFMLEDSYGCKTVQLTSESDALFVDKMVWHEMSNFSADCVLMVLASDWYDECDYIRSHDEFLLESAK